MLDDHAMGEGQKVGKRFRRYGKLDSDTANRKRMGKLIGKRDGISHRSRNTRIQAINIQKRFRRKEELPTRFGEARGERYIDFLKFMGDTAI